MNGLKFLNNAVCCWLKEIDFIVNPTKTFTTFVCLQTDITNFDTLTAKSLNAALELLYSGAVFNCFKENEFRPSLFKPFATS